MGRGIEIDLQSIEWENLGPSWEIESLEPSEYLPEGAEKAEVWRDENYDLKAKIVGTVTDPPFDYWLAPEGEPGSLLPIFELKGSSSYEILRYELGSCALGNVNPGGIKNGESPVVDFERELFTSGALRANRHRDLLSETEWLTEWYLNGPPDQIISTYPRGSHIRLEGKYVRKRNLPSNAEDSFEASKTVGGTRFAFVQTKELSFVVQRVPKDFGPPWSECLAIEYRPVWGEIPTTADREAIGNVVGFVIGRELVNIGYTRFDELGIRMEQLALHPHKNNLIALCQQAGSLRPVSTKYEHGGIEPVLNDLLPNYLALKNELRLNDALKYYWMYRELPIGFNLPLLQAGIEVLAEAWFRSTKSKPSRVYIRDEEIKKLLSEEFESAEAKLQNHKYKDQILRRMRSNYTLSVNDTLRFFFDAIQLPVSEKEWSALRERNPMAHGRSSVFDSSGNEKMREATYICDTLFHRILLKVLGYQGYYIDYGTLGHPERPLNQPSGESA